MMIIIQQEMPLIEWMVDPLMEKSFKLKTLVNDMFNKLILINYNLM